MSDDLTPTEELVIEVLAARTRTGEPFWTFDYRHRPAIRKLARKDLVAWEYGSTERSIEVRLTPNGRDACLKPGYVPTGARIEWGVQTDHDPEPVHYVLSGARRRGGADVDEDYHRSIAARTDGTLLRRAVIVLPWEQVPLEAQP